MVENIPDGNSPGGVWLVGIFRVGIFLTPKLPSVKFLLKSIHRSRQINKTNSIWIFPDFNFIFLLK